MGVRPGLLYSREHIWTSAVKGEVEVGVTSYAVTQLGEIVAVDLPKVGAVLEAGDSFGTIESSKTVSDLYAPVSGVVKAVNPDVLAAPQKVGLDPFEKGWLIKVEAKEGSSLAVLDEAQYRILCEEEDG